MKVTFVLSETGLSGGIRAIAEHAQGLMRKGHQVTLVSPGHRRFTWMEILKTLLKGRKWPKALPPNLSHFTGRNLDLRVLPTHRPITAQDVPDADVVIATWWETAYWVMDYPAGKGVKAQFLQDYEVRYWEWKPKVDAVWRLPMHKIVVAQWLKDLARDEFGDPDASLVINAVDHKDFYSPPRGRRKTPTLGTVYSRVPVKTSSVAGEAYQIIKRQIPEAKLISFGIWPPASDMPMPAEMQFTLRPDAAKIRELYGSADVWLWSSKTEGFGLPILEAMACRTPVAATPAGAAREILADGGGFVTCKHSAQELADHALRILSMSDSEWRALSERALAVSEQYTWAKSVDLFEAALMRALESSRSQAPSAGLAGKV